MERDPEYLHKWFNKLEAGWEQKSPAGPSANNANATSINSSWPAPNATACTASHESRRTIIENQQSQFESMTSELQDTKKELEDAEIGWSNCSIKNKRLKEALSRSHSMLAAVGVDNEQLRADAELLFEAYQHFSNNGQYSGINNTVTGQSSALGQGQPTLGNDNTGMVRYY
ncbi:uncharacterized protein L203_104909 [Cryptococcus depauperatus CBS 7841]|uniref:Uncharacterized protein n=1 Tax=Cryptococcus depauperatus CBS 7841 TaxID=1295531 RepID=A0A1E3INF7_9TREE|nr:hypothetical protein L203_01882 [Cryptococcus depauperatus CBS 7841]